jgi:hypothetical protein
VTFQRWFAVASVALLGACSVLPEVDTFAAPEVDFAASTSFAWKGGEFALSENTRPEVAASGAARIREAVVAELVRKGFVETADAAAADMLVSFQVGAVRRTVMPEARVGAPIPSEVLTVGGQPTPAASELPRERTVREGTVVVFVEDPASGRVGWRGLVNVEGRVGSHEAAIRQITDIARHITQQFPARRTTP